MTMLRVTGWRMWLKMMKLRRIFFSRAFLTAENPVPDCIYAGQSPDVHGQQTAFILANLQICKIHLCTGAGHPKVAQGRQYSWWWKRGGGGDCMRKSAWLPQTSVPPTAKSKRGGQQAAGGWGWIEFGARLLLWFVGDAGAPLGM